MNVQQKCVSLGGCVFFAGAALVAIQFAVAETFARQDTAESTTKALAIQGRVPSSELELRLSELDPAHAQQRLEAAIRSNPRSSAAWISLGLLEEPDHPLTAEQSLLHAASVDRGYLPSWTLANFYFRTRNRDRFWEWANRAATLSYDDLRPLLQLADQFEPSPTPLFAHFKDTRRLRLAYLDFLIGENRLDAAQEVARTLRGAPENDPYLIDLADRQLRVGNTAAALELWNAASGLPPIGPSTGKILTNGDLARSPSNLGFDWRFGQGEGIAENWRPFQLVFQLSGAQPEACVLLKQTIPLDDRHFRLLFDYVTTAPAPTSIHWSLDEQEGPPIEPSPQWRQGAFELPPRSGLHELRLFYRRQPGTIRTPGQIEIRKLQLEVL